LVGPADVGSRLKSTYSHAPIPHVKSQKRNPCQAGRICRQGALGPVLPLGRLWCFAFVRAKRTGLCRGQANVTTGCEGANPGLRAVARIAGSWSLYLCDSPPRPHLGSPGGVSVEILQRMAFHVFVDTRMRKGQGETRTIDEARAAAACKASRFGLALRLPKSTSPRIH
jgi:hypothetical protein